MRRRCCLLERRQDVRTQLRCTMDQSRRRFLIRCLHHKQSKSDSSAFNEGPSDRPTLTTLTKPLEVAKRRDVFPFLSVASTFALLSNKICKFTC